MTMEQMLQNLHQLAQNTSQPKPSSRNQKSASKKTTRRKRTAR